MINHNYEDNGDDELGRSVATGMYIYRLTAGSHIALKKMIFTR